MKLALALLALPLLVVALILAPMISSRFFSPPLVTDFGVAFPKHGGSSNEPSEDVAGGGVLVLDDAGCLRVGTDRGPEGDDRAETVPIWPRDSELVVEGDDVLIVDWEGEEVARVGDKVEMNGAPLEAASPQQELVDRCPGNYFKVGNQVDVVRRPGVPAVDAK